MQPLPVYGKLMTDSNWLDPKEAYVRLEDYTYTLIRQVDVIALVRSFRPISIEEFDNIAQPLIL